MSNGIIILPVRLSWRFLCCKLKPKAGASQKMQRFTRPGPEIQLKIRFQSGFQALVDMRSHKLAWIRIVHNAVLQPDLRWVPKAFKRAKPNWPPILKEEISGHISEKAYLTKWIQWQRKRCTRAASPSSGNRKPRTQLYLATSSAKNKTQGVYRIKGLGLRLQPVSIILWENNSRTYLKRKFSLTERNNMRRRLCVAWLPPPVNPHSKRRISFFQPAPKMVRKELLLPNKIKKTCLTFRF